MANPVNNLFNNDPLLKLIQEENFIGWIYSIDYDSALVVTNDLWKSNVNGVPHNSFLVASSINPNNLFNSTDFQFTSSVKGVDATKNPSSFLR